MFPHLPNPHVLYSASPYIPQPAHRFAHPDTSAGTLPGCRFVLLIPSRYSHPRGKAERGYRRPVSHHDGRHRSPDRAWACSSNPEPGKGWSHRKGRTTLISSWNGGRQVRRNSRKIGTSAEAPTSGHSFVMVGNTVNGGESIQCKRNAVIPGTEVNLNSTIDGTLDRAY